MNLNNYFNKHILEVLQDFKKIYPIVEFSHIEDDEFLKVPEEGFYLQASNGSNLISSYRIYIHPIDGYSSAKKK